MRIGQEVHARALELADAIRRGLPPPPLVAAVDKTWLRRLLQEQWVLARASFPPDPD
jgi:hypothetical protein